MSDLLPQRQWPASHSPVLRHNTPTILFVTATILSRRPILSNDVFHTAIQNIWAENSAYWQVGYYLIMPDHIHLFCAPGSNTGFSVKQWVQYWKRECSKTYPVVKGSWQQSCWDTQIRNGEHYARKLDYVANNPVRKGMCSHPNEWPFQGHIGYLEWYGS